MLTGTYEHSLDPKGRLFIPAKLREELGTDIVLTQSPNKCINIYPLADWEALAAKILALPMTETIEIRRRFFPTSVQTTADSQGRVLISNILRSYAGLEKDAVIIGNGNYLEIWDKDAWTKANSSEFDMMAALKELGI